MVARFAYDKAWGAEWLGDRARVRLWAPSQESLSLVAGDRLLPMERDGEGWFALETDAVGPGEPYAFALADGLRVPDPAARAQMGDVHGPSRLIDSRGHAWRTGDWKGRPWEEAVIYELHVGTFAEQGTFDGVREKLDHLAGLGVTAIELMPVAQFSGNRGWGYDGVLPYAPHVAYGGPEGLKHLVDAAHARGLMVLLDVVYNHFGPDGNYLHLYAPEFFNPGHHTPWGAGIAFERRPVRDFFMHNALYWLEEYRVDGLRLDAIDQIADDSAESILVEIARAVRDRITDRQVHLTTEDERNITTLHERDEQGRPRLYTAEWNDDWHHAAHVLLTGEDAGYYRDYQKDTAGLLARALAEGYIYQGEPAPHWDGAPRGQPSAHLPPVAFVDFLQNHDQIGNRAFGERITTLAEPAAVEAALALLLLGPHIPLLFMGEEWGERRPFLFFADYEGDLADAVREGRRNEFREWPQFRDPATRARIPDPNALTTFDGSKLDWSAIDSDRGGARLDLVRELLAIRAREIVPRLTGMGGGGEGESLGRDTIRAAWRLGQGTRLAVWANLGAERRRIAAPDLGRSGLLYETPAGAGDALAEGRLPPWSVVWRLERAEHGP